MTREIPRQAEAESWVGFLHTSGRRAVTPDSEIGQALVRDGYQFVQLFSGQPAARTWKAQEILDLSGENEAHPHGSWPAPGRPRKPSAGHGKKKKANLTKRSSRYRDSGNDNYPSDDSSSSGEGSGSSSSSGSSTGDHSSSDDEDTTSSEEGQSGRRSRKKSKKKKASSKGHQKGSSKRKVKRKEIGENDKSLGDPKRVHGMGLTSDKLTASLGPKHLSLKDGDALFELGVDVLGLPGMYRVKMDEKSAEAERAMMATTGLIQAAMGKKGRRDPIDAYWKSSSRHMLSAVKEGGDLQEFIATIDEVREETFNQQEEQISVFMGSRNYSDRDIAKYQARGGMVLITKATYRYYLDLLHTLRHRYHDAPKDVPWKQTQAYALLDHHSKKLLTLRGTTTNKKLFLLKVYVYLRDAHKAQFYHNSLNQYLWNQLNQASQSAAPAKDPARAKTPATRCEHCRHKGLHDHFDLAHDKSKCPFKGLSQTVARKAGAKGYELAKKDSNLSLTDMIAKAKAAVSAD
jgi:hypothetical protein